MCVCVCKRERRPRVPALPRAVSPRYTRTIVCVCVCVCVCLSVIRTYIFLYVCRLQGPYAYALHAHYQCICIYVCRLQGPYVYALYAHYEFSKQQIALLFIFGFGASAVFGTYAGEMSDKYGRRLSCFVYCGTYIVSCLTKHSVGLFYFYDRSLFSCTVRSTLCHTYVGM
jgi:MFS family permease